MQQLLQINKDVKAAYDASPEPEKIYFQKDITALSKIVNNDLKNIPEKHWKEWCDAIVATNSLIVFGPKFMRWAVDEYGKKNGIKKPMSQELFEQYHAKFDELASQKPIDIPAIEALEGSILESWRGSRPNCSVM